MSGQVFLRMLCYIFNLLKLQQSSGFERENRWRQKCIRLYPNSCTFLRLGIIYAFNPKLFLLDNAMIYLRNISCSSTGVNTNHMLYLKISSATVCSTLKHYLWNNSQLFHTWIEDQIDSVYHKVQNFQIWIYWEWAVQQFCRIRYIEYIQNSRP